MFGGVYGGWTAPSSRRRHHSDVDLAPDPEPCRHLVPRASDNDATTIDAVRSGSNGVSNLMVARVGPLQPMVTNARLSSPATFFRPLDCLMCSRPFIVTHSGACSAVALCEAVSIQATREQCIIMWQVPSQRQCARALFLDASLQAAELRVEKHRKQSSAPFVHMIRLAI